MATRVYGLLVAAACICTISAQMVSEGLGRRHLPGMENQYAMSFRGQVVSSEPALPLSELLAELCDVSDMNRVVDTAAVAGSGEFSFLSVPEGMYTVRIVTRTGAILGESMAGASGVVRVDIHAPKQTNPLAGSVISIAELKHKAPANALKEAKQANDALKKHDLKSLILHLEKAVALDPGFIAARRNLANAYLTGRQFDRAADAYRELLALDSHSIVGYMGLSAAYLSTNRVQEAETPARKAVEIDSSSELAHYLLGCSLAGQGNDLDAALSHLGRALKSFPSAHLVAARVLAREGRKDEAKMRLQAYLESGDAYARSEAEQLLNALY